MFDYPNGGNRPNRNGSGDRDALGARNCSLRVSTPNLIRSLDETSEKVDGELDFKMDDVEHFFKACFEGRFEEISSAIRSTPELVNSRCIAGRTPLHQAAFGGSGPVVKLLIQHGADPNARTDFGWVPLHYAAAPPAAEAAVHLIQNGAAVNIANDNGATPLHHAVDFGKFSLVELLLSHGVDVNAEDEDGRTPLDFAEPDSTIAQLLLKCGARGKKPFASAARLDDLPDWLKGHENEIDELLRNLDDQWNLPKEGRDDVVGPTGNSP